MLNSIILQGRITKQIEIRVTQTQKPVATFAIAVDRDFGDKETDFVPIVAWNKTAEFCEKYLSKGSLVVVSGRLQSREWTDKDGKKHVIWEVVADRVYFGESKKNSKTSQTFEEIDEEIDEELPF